MVIRRNTHDESTVKGYNRKTHFANRCLYWWNNSPTRNNIIRLHDPGIFLWYIDIKHMNLVIDTNYVSFTVDDNMSISNFLTVRLQWRFVTTVITWYLQQVYCNCISHISNPTFSMAFQYLILKKTQINVISVTVGVAECTEITIIHSRYNRI